MEHENNRPTQKRHGHDEQERIRPASTQMSSYVRCIRLNRTAVLGWRTRSHEALPCVTCTGAESLGVTAGETPTPRCSTSNRASRGTESSGRRGTPPHTTNRSTGTGSPHDEPAPATQLVSTSSHTVGRDGRGGAGTPASARARQGRGPSHADLSPLVSAGRRRSTEAWTQCFHSCDDPEAPAHSRWGTRVSPAARL